MKALFKLTAALGVATTVLALSIQPAGAIPPVVEKSNLVPAVSVVGDSASAADPDTTPAGAPWDITNLSVDLDYAANGGKAKITVETNGQLPAKGDSAWVDENSLKNDHMIVVALDGEFNNSLFFHRGGTDLYSEYGPETCTGITETIATSSPYGITFDIPKECIRNLGVTEATAYTAKYDAEGDTTILDAAIADGTAEDTELKSISLKKNEGVYLVASDGGIFSFGGNAPFYGSMGGKHLNQPMVGIATAPGKKGYYTVASDGGIFAYGPDFSFKGSMGGKHLNKPMVGMATTPDGQGYWTVASDGGIFAYGTAGFYGSMGGKHLNQPIVGMAATPSGLGYYLVASDGGIFAYGDAQFAGSMGGKPLNKPMVGMTASPTGTGYTTVASDGGIFNYGAPFHGSGVADLSANRADSLGLADLQPAVALTNDASGSYRIATSRGAVFNYGDSASDLYDLVRMGITVNKPVVGAATVS